MAGDEVQKRQMLFAIGFMVALYYITLSIGGFSLFKSTRIPHIVVENSLFGVYDNSTINIYAVGNTTGIQTSSSTVGKIHVSDFYPDEAGAVIADNTSKLGGALLSLSSTFIDLYNGMPILLSVEAMQFLPYLFIVSFSFLLRGVMKLIYVIYSVKTSDKGDDTKILFRLADIQFFEQIFSAVESMVVLRMVGITDISTLVSMMFFIVLFESVIYAQHELYFIYNKELKDVRQSNILYEYSGKCWTSILVAACFYIYIIIACANFGHTFSVIPSEWETFAFTVSSTAIATCVLYFLFRFLLCALGIIQIFFGEKLFTNPYNTFSGFQVLHTFLHVAAVTVLAAGVFNLSVIDDQVLV